MIGTIVDVTERNRAQRRRAELAAELRTAHDEAVRRGALTDAVLHTVGVGIVACDADGHLTTFNRATREFHGMPPDPDLDPVDWADRYALYTEDGHTPLTREAVPLFRALTEGVVEDAVIVIAPQGLPARTVRCEGRALRDPAGQVLGAVVVMSDITQSRAAAHALDEHAEFTRVLLETAHAAIWSFDATGRPTFVNPSAREMLGWPDLESLQQLSDDGQLAQLLTAVQLLSSDGSPMEAAERPLARALAGQHTGEVEVLLVAPGRPERAVLLQASPLHNDKGTVGGALITGHDVTALRASEARFRAAFHDGPTPVARLDADGVVVETNPALRRLTSLREQLLVGRPLADHVPVEDRVRLRQALAGSGTGAEPVEVRVQRADGTALWCELATTLSADPDGGVSVLAQFLDVDARKRQELTLERAARRDPLTGLANRSELGPLAQALQDGPADTTIGMLFLDLDGFKTVNDVHGHDAGDAVLVEVARRLTASVRPTSSCASAGTSSSSSAGLRRSNRSRCWPCWPTGSSVRLHGRSTSAGSNSSSGSAWVGPSGRRPSRWRTSLTRPTAPCTGRSGAGRQSLSTRPDQRLGRGTGLAVSPSRRTGRGTGPDAAVPRTPMATRDLRFFEDPEAQLLPDGNPRRGSAWPPSRSGWLHVNSRLEGAWQQRYERGVPVTDHEPFPDVDRGRQFESSAAPPGAWSTGPAGRRGQPRCRPAEDARLRSADDRLVRPARRACVAVPNRLPDRPIRLRYIFLSNSRLHPLLRCIA